MYKKTVLVVLCLVLTLTVLFGILLYKFGFYSAFLESHGKQSRIVDFGYDVLNENDAYIVYYSVKIENPNPSLYSGGNTIAIIAYDKNRNELASKEDPWLPEIPPGSVIGYGARKKFKIAKRPETIEIRKIKGHTVDEYWSHTLSDVHRNWKQLKT